MDHYLIRLSLISLVIHFNYGFYLPRIDLQHPTKLLYKSNDGSTLSVSDSYVEKPTLKEIIYYHLIERPYPEGQEQEKIKPVISENTFESVEDLDIDPRKDKPVKNSYSTQKPKYVKRQRRDVSLERIPSKRAKRTFYRNWGPFTSDLSKIHTQHLPDYVREIFTEEKPILNQQNSKYAYLVGRLPSTQVENNNVIIDDNEADDELDSESNSDESDYTEEPNVVEYLEYDEHDDENNSSEEDDDISIEKEKDFNDKNKLGVYIQSTTIRNNKYSGANSKVSDTSEDDLSDTTAWNDDNDSDDDSGSIDDEEIGCEDGEDCDKSGEDTNPYVDENSTIQLSPGMIDNPQNPNVLNFVHNALKEHSKLTNQDIIIKTNPDQTNFFDALRGLFTNIVKNNVVINNHVPITPKTVDITAEKDRIKERENPNKTSRKPVTEQNFKDNSSPTESPKGKVTPTVDVINKKTNKSNDIGQSKDTDVTSPPLEPTTATAIINKATYIDKNALNDTEDQTTINKISKEANTSEDIDQSKDNNFTSPSLDSTTATVIVLNATEIHEIKSNDTDKLINSISPLVSSTTPAMTTESSSQRSEEPTTPGKQEPTTANPTKIENNATNEKENDAGANKKNDFMLDLLNNVTFWKFMGDLGGKYLDSLMAQTQSVIKKQIATQIEEHLDALNKYDEKLLKNKEKAKENKQEKILKDNTGKKNTVAKNINETISIKAHNLYGNTVGNDKVTNVYVFNANEHIDELIKNIHEIANKVKLVNSTNIFTFIPNKIEVNSVTNKFTTPIENEVTTKLPITTVNPVAEKPNNEQNPTEPTTNAFDNKHPNNADKLNKTDSNCDHNLSPCDNIKVGTKPTVNPDQNNITVQPAEHSVDSTTVSKEQTPDVTTLVVDFKIPVTETTDKPTPTTDIVLSKEPITAKIDVTTESVAAKQTTVVQVTEVQTEITQHTTHSKGTTNANPTTEPVISKVTIIADTTTASSMESTSITQLTTLDTTTESPLEKSEGISHHNDETQNATTGDKVTTESVKPETSDISSATEVTSTASSTVSNDDGATVNTEIIKPVTDNISSSTEVTSTIQPTTLDTTTGSTTEKDEDVHRQNTTTSDIDKVSTESMKPETSDISSTTEITTTAVSETTVESTTEIHHVTSESDKAKVTSESTKPETSDISSTTEITTTAVSETIVESTTEIHHVTSDSDKAKVTSESTKPETNDISLTTEITTTAVSETIVESTTEIHHVTSDDEAKVTLESTKLETSDISSTTEIITTAVSETTVESTTEKHNVTSDSDKAKVTSESMKPETSDISSTTEITTTAASETTVESTTEIHHITSDDEAKVTSESMNPETSDISSTTEITTTVVSETTAESTTEIHHVTSDSDKAKVTSESTKPETTDISSTTEITATAVSETTVESTTEKYHVTSDSDKAKVTSESTKLETSDISTTTEMTTTAVSETTVESTTEKYHITSDSDKAKVTSESTKPETSDSSSVTEGSSTVSDVTSEENKATIATETINPMADNISTSTEFASHDTVSTTDLTTSDPKDIITAKPSGKIDKENDNISTEPSLTKLNSDDAEADTLNTTDSVTNNIKLTTEAITTETDNVSMDEANKNYTISNNEGSNYTFAQSETSSTTESTENKIDSIDISTESVTEKATDNTKSTNDESSITTEKAESTKVDMEAKEATESTTEKQEEEKS